MQLDRIISLLRSAASCVLKVLMIACRVWRPFGIFTPLVARAAIDTIFWNDGWQNARIGYN